MTKIVVGERPFGRASRVQQGALQSQDGPNVLKKEGA